MSKLGAAFGDKYQAKRKDILTRTFELGGHIFKVRIPLVSESDAMYKRIETPDEARVEQVYKEMTEPLEKFRGSDEFQFLENDVMIGDRSMREAAQNKVLTEARITEFFKLLIPEVPETTLDDLTYADIESEFPLSVQLQIIEKIGEAISPTYRESRKN